jgi:hypothetical protein
MSLSNSNGLHEKINAELITKIKNLFKSVKKTSEFEFIFFSKQEKQLTLEKYISLLKFLSKRTSLNKNLKLIKEEITLDIAYNPDKENSYRCTLVGKESIDKYMKKFGTANNHVIFRNFVKWSKKDKDIQVMKKVKSADNTVDVDDLYMRVRLSNELPLDDKEMKMLIELDETHIQYISFRFKTRTTLYVHEKSDEYVKIDLTTTKTEYTYNRLNNAIPRYELEIETKSDKANTELLDKMFQETETLFKIIQQSNAVIIKSEAEKVINNYKTLLSVPVANQNALYGRQPVSLEIQYIENLANRYAVTDKADGERHFLVIFDKKVYLINKNLDVKNTGIVLKNDKYDNSVMDGELIFIKGRYSFLVFDCLFDSGVDVRTKIKLEERLTHADNIINASFIFGKQKGIVYEKSPSKDFNLNKELTFHKNQIKKMIDNYNYDIELEKHIPLIRRKYFIFALGAKSWEIYAYASLMWNAYTSDPNIKCPYILDGLIFQPNEQSYVANVRDSRYSDYKWKPQEKNSIDFYIEFLKDNNGDIMTVYDNSYDEIDDDQHAIETGTERIRNQNYKICRLHVGQSTGKTQIPVLFKENENLHEAFLLL